MNEQIVAGLIGALVGSLITGLFAWLLQKEQQKFNCKRELEQSILKLVELRDDINTEVPKIADSIQREELNVKIHSKIMLYLESCQNLVAKIPNIPSSSECINLANQFSLEANFAQAEKYYKKAIIASKSLLYKVNAIRHLAGFYFSQGPQRNFDKGRDCFKKAINLLGNPTDPYSIFTQGFNYESWGLVELQNGFTLEGNQKIDNAKKYYKDLPDDYTLKAQSIGNLENRIKSILDNQRVEV